MISKKLLEEVLNTSIKYLSDELEGNLVPYETSDGWKTINVYELANKCKKWVVKKHGYGIDSDVGAIDFKETKWGCSIYTSPYPNPKYFTANTEYEAIFNACKWVLNQQKKPPKDDTNYNYTDYPESCIENC